jgi:hypothetical protein
MEKVKKYKVLYWVFLFLAILPTGLSIILGKMLVEYIFQGCDDLINYVASSCISLTNATIITSVPLFLAILSWFGFYYFYKKYKAAQREAVIPKS